MRFGAIQLSAMLAALVLSAGLVLRISTTLTAVAPETRSDTAAKAAIQIRDDRNGVTMFQGVDLAPGTGHERCITIRATGSRTPDEIVLAAVSSIDPALAPWVQLEVARGPVLADDSGACDGFVTGETVAAGPFTSVMDQLDRGRPWIPSPTDVIPGGHAATYRVTATLLEETPNEIQGARANFDLLWASDFDPTGQNLLERTLALAVRFTEDSIVPMLAIIALAILFLGIQDRLDVATPRLSKAALFDEIIEFEDRGNDA